MCPLQCQAQRREKLAHTADWQGDSLTMTSSQEHKGRTEFRLPSLLGVRAVITEAKKTGMTELPEMEGYSCWIEQSKQVFSKAYHAPGKLLGAFTYAILFILHSHLLGIFQ